MQSGRYARITKYTRLAALGLILALLGCCVLPLTVVADEAAGEGARAQEPAYIYFDLSAGNVTINGSAYTGYRYDGQTTAKTITGTLQDGEAYYVYQSDGDTNTGLINGSMVLPEHERVTYNGKSWGDYVTNNKDVEAVIKAWNEAAPAAGRVSTPNRIAITGKVNTTLVIDNLYSSYHQYSTGRTTGGISFDCTRTSSASTLKISMIGDNRFGNIYYGTGSYAVHQLTFEEKTAGATLTVANLTSNSNMNYWNAAIGASDSTDHSRGIVINSGTIFAGTNAKDDCTAIGGGGNGYGVVTINGGRVTATVASSGAAIGGGIGKTAQGGQAVITITGGEVYAYNASCASRGYSDTRVQYIPSAAIGGGSSARSTCNPCTVTITGGYVYAESVGGTAIGGGSSADTHGGTATINITGGEIHARSIEGVIAGQNVPAGVAIGGGTGGTNGNGGNVTFTVSDASGSAPILETGSIGGGATISQNGGKIGHAEINISAGDISGQFIMAEGAAKNCSFTMTGGTIDNADRDTANYVFLQENGGAIYMDDSDGVGNMSGGIIKNCSAVDGGAVYMTAGSFTLSEQGSIKDCTATQDGGAIYLGGGTLTVSGGSIQHNSAVNGAGVYMLDGTMTVSGGVISQNKATQNGGAAYLGGGKLTVSGGSITNNTAVNGAGAYLENGTMTVSGGAISENEASSNGGAAYLGGGTLEISGTAEIKSNTSVNGAGVYMLDGTMTVSGGAISENKASSNGGAAYLGGGTLTVSNGTITNNTAVNGAGAYLEHGTMTVSGGSISQNVASSNGGGAYLGGGILTISKGSVTGNQAVNGGGAYVNGGDVVILEGLVTDNTAVVNGGGVVVNNGNFKMYGGEVSRNAASKHGGGIYVSAQGTEAVNVDIFSGTLEGNNAPNSGGALAVVAPLGGTEIINVTIGVNHQHYALVDGEKVRIDCHHTDSSDFFEGFLTCPVMKNNSADNSGGAIYIIGGQTTNLNMYCLVESGSKVTDEENSKSNFMLVEGGKVIMTTQRPDEDAETSNDDTYGIVSISESIYVKGGQMIMDGSMSNPLISSDTFITVDVAKEEDYQDFRYGNGQYYKLQYFENFKNDYGTVSGQYTVFQIPHGGTHQIMSSIYSHPGYEIQGWFTNKDGTGDEYIMGTTYTFTNAGTPEYPGDLIIYAQWERNGYTVVFLPNVEDEDTYTGEMPNLELVYGQEVELPAIAFKYPGRIFVIWKDEETGKTYTDQQIIKNLTNEKGKTIYLTAQWTLCPHSGTQAYFTYTADGAVLTRECSCLGYTDTATLRATDSVYDKARHENAVLSVTTENLNGMPVEAWTLSIVYSRPDGKYVEGDAEFLVNAGTYAATVTDGGKTAAITYQILKADQADPPKPDDYTADSALGTLTVTPVAASGNGTETLYRLIYFVNNTEHTTEWQTGVEFTFDAAYTYYTVQVMYAEGENYNPSSIISSATAYFYDADGKIRIDLVLGVGIQNVSPKPNPDGDSGVIVTLLAQEGYYLPAGLTVTLTDNSDSYDAATALTVTKTDDVYLIDGTFTVPTDDELLIITITFSDAYEAVNVSSSVAEKEIFGPVYHDDSVVIGRDSAFTAYFEVNDYFAYTEPALDFGTYTLPAETTVIMMDQSDGSYWYYRVPSGTTSAIPLASFIEMGGSDTYVVPTVDAYENRAALQYRFIIDFSKTENGYPADTLSVQLTAQKDSAKEANVPAFDENGRTITLADVTFDLSAGTGSGMTNELNVTYAQSSGAASKWDYHKGALVLTPLNDLPADAHLKIVENGSTTVYYMEAGGCFILPLRTLADSATISITMESQLAGAGQTYRFSTELYASASQSGKTPINGTVMSQAPIILSFSTVSVVETSLKITGDQRLYNMTETDMSVTVAFEMPETYTITAAILMKADDGTYFSTGVSVDDIIHDGQMIHTWTADPNDSAKGALTMNISSQRNPGSYCLELTVKNDVGETVLRVPYYFIKEYVE